MGYKINLNNLKNRLALLRLVGLGYFLILIGRVRRTRYFFEVVLWENSCLSLRFRVLIDRVRIIFSGTVLVISGRVSIYCKWYMETEVYYKRFIGLVWLFVLSIIFMILIPNLVILLIG